MRSVGMKLEVRNPVVGTVKEELSPSVEEAAITWLKEIGLVTSNFTLTLFFNFLVVPPSDQAI